MGDWNLPCAGQINPNAVLVSKRQEGNPVLKHIRNVRWQFTDIVPDYQMGAQTCALFLSLRCVIFHAYWKMTNYAMLCPGQGSSFIDMAGCPPGFPQH